jgi:hypothetical protein
MDGRTFWVRPVGSWVLESNNMVAETLVFFSFVFCHGGIIRDGVGVGAGG